MDFDRDAIGSLEDLHREWDGLETERAKVEDRLRSFETGANRGAVGWRGGRGDGRGGRGGTLGGRGVQASGGDWSRDRPRENAARSLPSSSSYHTQNTQSYSSREKHRAMSGKWQRGLDPATAAMSEQEPTPAADKAFRNPSRSTDNGNNNSGSDRRGGVMPRRDAHLRRAGLAVGPRGVGGGNRDMMERERSRNVLRNGSAADSRGGRAGSDRRGVVGGGRREEFPRGRGEVVRGGKRGEPEAKRPRVTSTIVVADGGGGGNGTANDRELDRWDAGPGLAEDGEGGKDAVMEVGSAPEASGADGPADGAAAAEGEDDDNDSERPRFTSTIVVVPDARGRVRRGGYEAGPRGQRDNRGFAEGGGKGGGRSIRGSLASRLGPAVGRPVEVEIVGGRGGRGGVGGGEDFVGPAPPPMPEPSKPELQSAYKDGDTKNRNRRMFGGLMAHLGRARQQLDQDKPMIQRQNSVAEMAASRQVQEKMKQRQREAEAIRQERDEELHKRDYIDARQQKTLVALHGNAYIANQQQLRGFILTKILPSLAWTPNEHTDVTLALLASCNTEIDDRITEREEADDAAFRAIDDSVAQKDAGRTSRRVASQGLRESGDSDKTRGANPSGEGNEDRWAPARGETFDDDEAEGLSGKRKYDGGHGDNPVADDMTAIDDTTGVTDGIHIADDITATDDFVATDADPAPTHDTPAPETIAVNDDQESPRDAQFMDVVAAGDDDNGVTTDHALNGASGDGSGEMEQEAMGNGNHIADGAEHPVDVGKHEHEASDGDVEPMEVPGAAGEVSPMDNEAVLQGEEGNPVGRGVDGEEEAGRGGGEGGDGKETKKKKKKHSRGSSSHKSSRRSGK